MAEMEELSGLFWEILMEMEGDNCHAGEQDQGAVALVLDLAKAFGRVSLPVVWAWGDALQFPKEDTAGAMWVLRAPEGECSSKDVRRSRSRPSRLSCQGPSGVTSFCVLCCMMH